MIEEHLESSNPYSNSNSIHEQLTLEQKFQIVTSVAEECIGENDLLNLLASKHQPVCYDGFEPSGQMHIAQGVMKTINVKKLISAGCHVKILIADWCAKLNNKMGGDLTKIETVGRYMIEIWKAIGMDLEGGKVEFLWSSKEINARADEYWPLVLDIALNNSVNKIISCSEIMGRIEKDELTAAQIIYPCMQCADIFFHKVDICQLGMDQRKVNVLAREYCDNIKRTSKPIILSHHMLPGLQGQDKMSKSDPSFSSIFMDDDEAKVIDKIKKAYCPPKIVEGNPCLDYIKYVVLPWFNEFTVERNVDNGGNKTYKSFEELVVDYESGQIHPGDLKPSLSKSLNKILEPVREHFKKNTYANNLQKSVKAYGVTKKDKHAKPKSVKACGVTKAMEAPAAEALKLLSVSESSNSNKDQLTLEQKFEIVKSVGEECIQENELRNLIAKKPIIFCYDGFEPSGRMHIAQGIMKTLNVNKLISADCRVKIWIADWFAKLNNKMGGDLGKIETVGRYMIEIWKAIGMDLGGGKVEFLWSSKEINARADEYWPLVLDIASNNSLNRIIRCSQIMGRSEKDELTAAQIIYPCMQCADIFFLKADICQLGMDQRKVNVLAREYCDVIKRKNKPIILSHHMLPGLQEGQEKMSKSDPSSSIFMDDEEAAVHEKIQKAFCPPKIVEQNPCLEYIQYIVLPWFNEFTVERGADNGGNKTFKSFEELVVDYESGELHPYDLKLALSKSLNTILQPVRELLRKDGIAKELSKCVKAYRITK
ncbi:tyrosyl-tRNA synthetase [Trifolium pratense]|uniref:tyrosine--tRNA ligase n=1 Tax=Trifolium pratense TaxID=57577 RepID=A0A2K3NMU2_TRIPR|nr:tyrosyl-tRNA synthetase [Trifolium pratense]